MLESKAAFARRKGWNRSTVTRFAASGRLVVNDEGMVDVEASEARLTATANAMKQGVSERHVHDRRRAGREASAPGGADRADPNEGTTYELLQKHRAEGEVLKNDLLRMERDEKEGRLVDAEVVRKRELQLARAGRDAVMNLRYRLDPLLSGEADQAKRGEIWDRETRSICEDLARAVAAPLEAEVIE